MSFVESRREFMLSTARAGAALAVVGALPALAAVGPTGGAACATAAASVPVAVDADLLHVLGTRIGLEITEQLGADGAPVSLAYIDAGGPSIDALREGIERGIEWEAGHAPASREWQANPCTLLGAALVTNEATGQRALVEIEATALSMLSMIETVNVPASSRKHAVLAASADNLYRVRYFS